MKGVVLIFVVCLSLCCTGQERVLPEASWDSLPRWRGFNLLEKFSMDWSNGPFKEEDFKLISELGFNFVRLPMDYRTWIVDGDWNKFNGEALKEIDQAVEWGRKYRVHVDINFHRAPGYTVSKPAEKLSLWSDEEALEACMKHWSMFARRYKGISSRELSFNLFNEPPGITEEAYFKVVKAVCAAIRKEDPERLIIVDGLYCGTSPCFSLKELKVAQSTRGYSPFELTHYRAKWVYGSENMSLPSWPKIKVGNCIYGPLKKELQSYFIIENEFQGKIRLRLRIDTVSGTSMLVVRADNKIVLSRKFESGPGKGEWKKEVYRPEWENYQNVYDMDVFAEIPERTKRIFLENSEGDWMSISEIGLTPGDGAEFKIQTESKWGWSPVKIRFSPSDPMPFKSNVMYDRTWLWEKNIESWNKLGAEGVGIFVGEFGAYDKTPHDTVLRWMEDCLQNWKKAGWGWALWNFRGSFGILDSGRKDVKYEDFKGHKLDRKMLELLQEY